MDSFVCDGMNLICEFQNSEARHVFREGNAVAGVLAQLGRDSAEEFATFVSPPREVRDR